MNMKEGLISSNPVCIRENGKGKGTERLEQLETIQLGSQIYIDQIKTMRQLFNSVNAKLEGFPMFIYIIYYTL